VRIAACPALLVCLAACAPAAEPFELKDGDRVVWLGSTLIEREQRYGYWEAALTARWPDRTIRFRNLGWSGDNVFGEARLAFDINNPALGLKRMVDLTLAEKPTVIFICYGTNESFEGEAGLEKFKKGYEKLLDALKPANARLVLMAPPMFEDATWKGTNLEQHKKDLKLYTDTVRALANERMSYFVNEFLQRHGVAENATDDGMHLTAFGYWVTAGPLTTELKLGFRQFKTLELKPGVVVTSTQEMLQQPPNPRGQSALLTRETFEKSDPSQGGSQADCSILVHDLPLGKYTLRIDGKDILTEDASAWVKALQNSGVWVGRGPSLDQAEALRQAIIAKNRLYFYRWRPQNETYLFGFRKHEQGKNSKEVVEFDPLIAKAEEEIDRLKKPKPHRYELVPAEKK
jgi:lysophospholipase L1-like esterase